MEGNFTIIVGQKKFADGSSIEQTFKNELGLWYVIAKRSYYSMTGVVSLQTNVPDNLLSSLKPKVVLKCVSSTSYNAEIVAFKIPNQPCFLFSVYCGGFPQSYSTYEIKVEIDTSLIDLTRPVLPTPFDHFKDIFTTGKLADIKILAADGREIKAHNNVLSQSPVFDAMLNVHDTKEAQESTINITDIDYEVLVEMVYYMYSNEVPKIKEFACKLLLAANKYDIPGLADKCGNYLIKNVGIESYADVLVAADKLQLTQLKAVAIDFVIENRKDIFESDQWMQFRSNNINLGFEVLEKYALK